MKIIKQGIPKEELKAILNKTKRFECMTCGCIFEADEDEYNVTDDFNTCRFHCECPNCGRKGFEVKMR